MGAETLYPGIVYFELAKEMPLCPVGSQVCICDADGREHLWCKDIIMPLDTAIKQPDWFVAIDEPEQLRRCYENTIEYLMKKGKSRSEAKHILSIL